jgi:hypothetical protein
MVKMALTCGATVAQMVGLLNESISLARRAIRRMAESSGR